MKKLITKFITAALMCVCLIGIVPTTTHAAVNLPTPTSSAYIEVPSHKTVNVYRDKNMSIRGTASPAKSYNAYISTNDSVYITSMNSSYCYVSYPAGSTRKYAYCKTSDLLYYSSAGSCVKSKASCNTYNISNSKIGSISVGDNVWSIAKSSSGKYFVMYDAKSGSRRYKCGYISTADWNAIRGASGSTSGTYILSDSALSAAAKTYGLGTSSNAYYALKRINSKYASQLTATQRKGTLVFLFEGVGNSSSTSERRNAMCVVIKSGKVVYLNRNCSTLPDYPFNPKKNDGTAMPTLKSGVYSFITTNHKGKYAALNVSSAKVLRFNSKASFYSGTSAGINVHRRTTNGISAASNTWVNSQGCLLIGKAGTSTTSEYSQFVKAIGIGNSSWSGNTKYTASVSGKIVVDRYYAKDYLKRIGYVDNAISIIN